MRNARWMPGAVLATSLLLGVPTARADLVTWDYSGTISTIDAVAAGLFGGAVIGDAFTGSYTFETDTSINMDAQPADPTVGEYALAGMTFTLGGMTLSFGAGTIMVIDAVGGDTYDVSSPNLGSTSPASSIASAGVDLGMDAGTLFPDDDLPTTPPLFVFPSGELVLGGQASEGSFELSGRLTSLSAIPAPGAALLGLIGLGLVGAIRRRLA